MKNCGLMIFLTVFVSVLFMPMGGVLLAQDGGMPKEAIQNAYRTILGNADMNGDGKVSVDECCALMSTVKEMQKDCAYWDADGDGIITEDEYVQQVQNLGRRK